jgi:hypothetical protein
MTYSLPDAQPKLVTIPSMHALLPAHRILQLATPLLHAEYTLPGCSLVNILRSISFSYIQIFSTAVSIALSLRPLNGTDQVLRPHRWQ